jgi:hypothetical protein
MWHFAAGAEWEADEWEAFLKRILEGDLPPRGGKRAVFLRAFSTTTHVYWFEPP